MGRAAGVTATDKKRTAVLDHVQNKRGYLLSYHRLLAADDPELLAVYDELYSRITLAERALTDRRKELVWLGLLSAREEPTGRIHVERARAAGLSSGEMADALALAAAMRGYYSVEFAAEHWADGIDPSDAEARYVAVVEAARGHIDAATAEMIAVIVQAGLRQFGAMPLHLRRAFSFGVTAEEMREAFSFLLLPCGGNLFIHAVETWDSLARNEALPSPFAE
jgi:alkylhydroperoxidase/carboxymuconolactone decarboxylase family protein YurZ